VIIRDYSNFTKRNTLNSNNEKNDDFKNKFKENLGFCIKIAQIF